MVTIPKWFVESLPDGNRVRFVMRAAGLDEEEFARAVGYPDSRAVREVLAGGLMDMEMAFRIHARYPMIDELWLFTGHLRENSYPDDSSSCAEGEVPKKRFKNLIS